MPTIAAQEITIPSTRAGPSNRGFRPSSLLFCGKISRIPLSRAQGADRVYCASTWLSSVSSTRYCVVKGVQLSEKTEPEANAAAAA
ncbi:hypothetical protein PG994_003063 [Apiospora phragmitis]|uniref:Uncharacterized protein n=1 Tax=Apiospora phragmitis TaxID=2905665 RepID=A0ABR1W702_9PEZI